jgi:hypothetical protein
VLDVFTGADNLNPVFDRQGNILFLSDRDGFRNLYRFEKASGKVFQLTDFLTGISGITPYAPALTASVKENLDRVIFTHYFKGGYNLYRAKTADLLNREVPADSINLAPATLMKLNRRSTDIVEANLSKLNALPDVPDSSLTAAAYRPKFKLDFITGGGGVGVGTGGYYGGGATTGVAGSVDMLFGDVTGDNQVYSSVFLNGEIYDAGAAFTYLNRKKRIGWGVGLSHLPYSSGRFGYAGIDTLEFDNDVKVPAAHYVRDIIRTFENKVSAFAQYPFSKTLRLEAGASFAFYNNRVDRFDQYYDRYGRLIYQERKKVNPEDVGLNLFKGSLGAANVALVGDNSYFGIASPTKGYRYRPSAERYFGDFSLYNLTADVRGYQYLKPVTLAFRAMHYGRYGKDANSFFSQFLGYPWFVRGYDFATASELLPLNNRSVDELFGSKILVSNFEVRLPFTGPEQLAAVKSKFFFTELALFVDGGLAWDTFDKTPDGALRSFNFKPLMSAGASLRFNLFGALILEPYYAFPLVKESRGTFGLNIVPGW